MAGAPGAPFDALLSRSRRTVGLTQEELAEASELSARTISDLERGLTSRPRRDTIRRLADALNLTGQARLEFEVAGRGRRQSGGSAPRNSSARSATTGAGTPGDPGAWHAFVVAALDERGVAAARSALASWKDHAPAEAAWLQWADRLITLTSQGRLSPAGLRPLPTARKVIFVNREQQIAELDGFLDRVQRGRGGLALIIGPAGIGKSRLVIEALHGLPDGVRVEWLTLDRGEAGYRGWRRLLAPMWITVRRTELAPVSLLPHAPILDDLLLTSGEHERATTPFPGEVADAIAALMSHCAARQALLLVIDDAHRGGASSDQLLRDVARRVNSGRTGIIAALRPDELEKESPLHGYKDEAGARSAADLVVPIHVLPLDQAATARLIEVRTGERPPPWFAEQVLRQTGGRPQLINSTDIRAPSGNAGWAAGRLGAEGLRVLESTISGRQETERTVLQAAAVCATGDRIPPDLAAIVADLPAAVAEVVLDQERRNGSILAPDPHGYRFQHDSWIDALVSSCPPAKLRILHVRCLTSLRDDPAADLRRLALHAIGAGAALVGSKELATLARDGADLALSDYAFSAAADMYQVAARHGTGEERCDLLVRQSDALRFQGRWTEARGVLGQAISLARTLGAPGREAVALIRLERMIWSYGLDEKDLTQQIRDVIDRLPRAATPLRAQAQAALAMRLSITVRQYDDEQADLARVALSQLPAVGDQLARADIILGARYALQDAEPPDTLLDFDRQVLDLALEIHSAYHIGEALSARIIDLLRCGRLLEVPAAVRAHRDFARKSAVPLRVYSHELIGAMLALARGDFDAARTHTATAVSLSATWGESMAGEALMAQVGWLLYETGQVDGLTEMLAGLPRQSVSTLNEPVWALAAAIIYAEKGEVDQAIHILRDVCADTRDLQSLPRGPGRIGILAAAAMVAGHPVVGTALPVDEAARIGGSLGGLLAAHLDKLVVAGWPAVLLGSKHRYIGLAFLAARRPAEAAAHLARAAGENTEFPVLSARTRFDLARALMRQPAMRSEGAAEMERIERVAANLGMAGLARQATVELGRERFTQP